MESSLSHPEKMKEAAATESVGQETHTTAGLETGCTGGCSEWVQRGRYFQGRSPFDSDPSPSLWGRVVAQDGRQNQRITSSFAVVAALV